MRMLIPFFRLFFSLWMFLLFSVHFCFSQVTENFKWGTSVTLPAAQDWNFVKYGNTPVDLYTGTLSIGIPLYTYQDADFEIPVSLGYASSGYQPNIPSGQLGLGWYLNVGGSITREVRGAADDRPGDGSIGMSNEKGYLAYSKTGLDQALSTVFNSTTGVEHTPYLYKSGTETYETLSDIYTFKFGPHKGSFSLCPNEKVYVYNTNNPSGEYSIQIIEGPRFDSLSGITSILITTGDGYKYTFGGTENLKKHSVPDGEESYDNDYLYHHKEVLSWPLTQIEAPNGRKVVFKYSKAIAHGIWSPSIKRYTFFPMDVNTTPAYPFYRYNTVDEYYIGCRDQDNRIPRIMNQSYLDTIMIDDKINIVFTYSDKKSELYKDLERDSRVAYPLKNGKLLEKISVSDVGFSSGREIKQCRFIYDYTNKDATHSLGNRIPFLTHLDISGEGRYSMDYYSREQFPFHGTTGLDMWGYYMGEPRYELRGLSSKDQSPKFEASLKGVLKRITYPTGGYTEYTYEPHDCSRLVARKLENISYPFLAESDNRPVGGIRIRKITDYLSDTDPAISRTFLYTRKEAGSNGTLVEKSSGISLKYPLYISAYPSTRSLEPDLNEIGTGINPANYTVDNTHIEYSEVTEVLNDSSYIHYHFSNYTMLPDIIPDDITASRILKRKEHLPSFAIQRNAFSRHHQRGKLLQKDMYNKSGHLLHRDQNIYDYTKVLKKTVAAELTEYYFYLYDTYVDDYPLKTTRSVDYSGSDSLVKEVNFTYNLLGQVIRTDSPNSRGQIVSKKVDYVTDIKKPTNMHNVMRDRHLLNLPLNTETLVNNSLTERVKYEYACPYGSVIKLSRIYRQERGSNAPLNLDMEYTYNYQGNLIETKDREGLKTFYIWGYGGLYPLAVVGNGYFDKIRFISGFSNLQLYPLSGGLSESQISSLYKLSNSSVSVYDYIPFVGVKMQSDASGIRTHYTYDQYGRLLSVSDGDGSPLKTFRYNIQH